MDILEFAMQMEKDGEAYYRELATKNKAPGLVSILRLLADAEAGHYMALLKMKDEGASELPRDTVPGEVRSLFAQMIEEGVKIDQDVSGIDLYKKAKDIEEKSVTFYLEKANDIDSPDGKALLLKLADQEKRHVQIVESIIEFLSRPLPGNWLENAEWYQSETY